MNLKIFLPMGEKPPDTFGRGGDASPIQASLFFTFPRFRQILQEFFELQSAILRSIICPLIVIILHGTRLPPPAVGHEIALVIFSQVLPANTRQLTPTTAATTAPTIITDNHNNSFTTDNNNNTARSLIVIILYDSCLPQPPAATLGFGSALVFPIQHTAQKHKHNTITPPTMTACPFLWSSFIAPAFHLIFGFGSALEVLLQCPTHQNKQDITTAPMTARSVIVLLRTCLTPADTFGFRALVFQCIVHPGSISLIILLLLFLCTRLQSSFASAFHHPCGFGSVLAVPVQCPTRQHKHTTNTTTTTTTTTTKTAHLFIVILIATSDPNAINSFTPATNVVFHSLIRSHGNTHLRYHPEFLLPQGALNILAKPRYLIVEDHEPDSRFSQQVRTPSPFTHVSINQHHPQHPKQTYNESIVHASTI